MAGIIPKFSGHGPYTWPVLTGTVAGGQLVIPDGAQAGGVVPAGAGAKNCLGVSLTDGAVAGTDSATDAAARPAYVSVEGDCVIKVTFAAAATFGQKLKTAANGQVTPWVDGTDDPAMVVGYCFDTTVANGAVGFAHIRP